MILYNVLSELDGVLSESGALIDLYKAKELAFFDKTVKWLEKLEKLAGDNKWSFQAPLAGLRGQLVTAARIQREDAFNWMPKSKNTRRAREALAAETIRLAAGLAGDYVSGDRALQYEAANLLRQLLTNAILKGVVGLKPTNGNGRHIAQSWAAVASDPELGPASAHVVGLVGAYNAYILFDKCFDEIFINGNGMKKKA